MCWESFIVAEEEKIQRWVEIFFNYRDNFELLEWCFWSASRFEYQSSGLEEFFLIIQNFIALCGLKSIDSFFQVGVII